MLLEIFLKFIDVIGVNQFDNRVFGGKILLILIFLHCQNIKEILLSLETISYFKFQLQLLLIEIRWKLINEPYLQNLNLFQTLLIVILFQFKQNLKINMENAQIQQISVFQTISYFVKILALCFIVGMSRFLLILFSQLNSHHHNKKEQQSNGQLKEDKQRIDIIINQMKEIYYMLLTLLYIIYYFSAFNLPFILNKQYTIKIAVIFSVALVCVFGEIAPRIFLGSIQPRRIVGKLMWVISLAKLINKIIPLNSALKKIFNKQINSNIDLPFINKQNIYRMLNISQKAILERPIRQQQVQLLQKLRMLSINSVKGLLIHQSNIFLLDMQMKITQKLINHLSRYYFSKILLYSQSKNNIIGFLQFKQLISYEINEKISSKRNLIVTTIIKLNETDKLSLAFQKMIQSKVNFALVYNKQSNEFKGLVKLKDIFSQLLLNWYNYESLSVDRTFYTFSSQILTKQQKGILQEGQQQI